MNCRSIVGLLCLSGTLLAQVPLSPELIWLSASNSPLPSDKVNHILVDSSGAYWFACEDQDSLTGGVARFDGNSWQVFQPSSSGLPSGNVAHLALDGQGNLWVATLDSGLARFDGTGWQVFHTGNSPLPANELFTLTMARNGVLWIGTWRDGLVSYDGTSWQWFHPSNSALGSEAINFIREDDTGLLWIGTEFYGLQSFDGQSWQSHGQGRLAPGINTDVMDMVIDPAGVRWISGLEGGVGGVTVRYRDTVWTEIESLSGSFDYLIVPNAMALDTAGTPWLGTRSGLVHLFQDTLWRRIRLDSLSNLPIAWYSALAVDERNNKLAGIVFWDSVQWAPRGGGVLVYNENGVSLTAIEPERPPQPDHPQLYPVYPNPFNPSTRVRLELGRATQVDLSVFNVLGQKVAVLYSGRLAAGDRTFTLEARNLPGGVYFVVLSTPGSHQVQKAILLR